MKKFAILSALLVSFSAMANWGSLEAKGGKELNFGDKTVVYEVDNKTSQGWGGQKLEVFYRVRSADGKHLPGTDADEERYHVSVGCSNVHKVHLMQRQSYAKGEKIHEVDYVKLHGQGRYTPVDESQNPVLAYILKTGCAPFDVREVEDVDKEWMAPTV